MNSGRLVFPALWSPRGSCGGVAGSLLLFDSVPGVTPPSPLPPYDPSRSPAESDLGSPPGAVRPDDAARPSSRGPVLQSFLSRGRFVFSSFGGPGEFSEFRHAWFSSRGPGFCGFGGRVSSPRSLGHRSAGQFCGVWSGGLASLSRMHLRCTCWGTGRKVGSEGSGAGRCSLAVGRGRGPHCDPLICL